ncbi:MULTISPECIES: DUF3017 domain-containing protein [unclassified Streptomyces]|uniref:DUF3017 domain-containing protein n=1 Tax=unclassified Streptomyces TaxID=2593676 RepID=UPI00093D9C12|nr:DUF3017 domain-containing protein [Streptomyces sp. CB02058]OKI97777.1 hypothetical protein AMK10_02805 [Streptomyces sp. CB02058]
MGAGANPADATHTDGPADEAGTPVSGKAAEAREETGTSGEAGMAEETVTAVDGVAPAEAADAGGADGTTEAEGTAEAGGADAEGGGSGSTWAPSRRFSLTHDTARPEGGGRAAPGDAPAPARQWPLLTVLCTAGAGLLIVGTDPFAEAFRIGAMLMGAALLVGAVLRWVVPSVGMLAVRSRFTDLVTYGLMGTLIVLLALMAQPKPWLDVPFLQDAVHFTIR